MPFQSGISFRSTASIAWGKNGTLRTSIVAGTEYPVTLQSGVIAERFENTSTLYAHAVALNGPVFPWVKGSITGGNGTNAVSHTVTLPSFAAGDRLILFSASPTGGSGMIVSTAGWTELATFGGLSAIYRDMDGTEGSTVSLDTFSGLASRVAWIVYCIKAGTFDPAQAPEIDASVTAGNNPPSLTASWGADNNLFFALNARDDSVTSVTYPYADGQVSVTSPVAPNVYTMIGCYFAIAAATENPAAFTISPAAAHRAGTLVVRGFTPAASVKPPLLTDADTLYAHSIRTQITAPFYTNTSTYFAHTVSVAGATKTVPLLTNSSTLRAHSIQTILKPVVLTNSSTLRAHSIRTILKPTAFTNSSTLRAHSVRTILRPAILTNSNTLNAHSVRTRLTAPLLTNSNTLRAHSVRATVKPVNLVNSSTLNAHSIRTILKPGLLSNANTLYAHTVAVAGANKQAPLLVNSQTFYAHKIVTRITASLLTNSQTFFAHSIRRTLRPTNLVNSQTFFAHRIRTTIRPTNYVNSQTFQAHSIRRIITSALLTNSQQFFGHTVLAGNNVSAPRLVNSNTFGAHTVIVSTAPEAPQTGNFGGYISSPVRKQVDREALRRESLRRIKALYSVTAGVPYIPSTNRLYAPTLIIGPAPEEDDFGLSPVEIDEITDILDALEAIEAMEAINDIAGRAS